MTEAERDALRTMVRDAVSNEFAAQIAPLRERIMIVDGTTRQAVRDVAVLQHRVEPLERVVFGDPREKAEGLIVKVDKLSAALDKLNDQLETWQAYGRGAKWVLAALGTLGAFSAYPGVLALLKAIGVAP